MPRRSKKHRPPTHLPEKPADVCEQDDAHCDDQHARMSLPPRECSKAERIEYLCQIALEVGGWNPATDPYELAEHWGISEGTVRNNYSDALSVIRRGIGESAADIRTRCLADLRAVKQGAFRAQDFKAVNMAVSIEAKLAGADRRYTEQSDTERDPDSMTREERAAELREAADDLDGEQRPEVH